MKTREKKAALKSRIYEDTLVFEKKFIRYDAANAGMGYYAGYCEAMMDAIRLLREKAHLPHLERELMLLVDDFPEIEDANDPRA